MLGYSLKSILSFLSNKCLIPHIPLFIPPPPLPPPLRAIPFLLSAIPPDFLNEVSVFFFAYLRNFYFPPDICWRSFYGQILNNEKSAILIKHKFGS